LAISLGGSALRRTHGGHGFPASGEKAGKLVGWLLVMHRMRTLYDACVEDLRHSDYVLVECTCSHTQLLTRSMLERYHPQPRERIMELGSRMRCRQCDARGKVSISIKWAK
jgi:hypothetical protein